MSSNVSNNDDIIDSRDVIERIEELTEERAALEEDVSDATETLADALDDTSAEAADGAPAEKQALADAKEALSDWDEENAEELKQLKALQESAEYSSDWAYGATLVRDDYFEDFAQQEAEELGLVSKDMPWPQSCIDWEQVAEELKMDYTSVDFDGVTYWIRS